MASFEPDGSAGHPRRILVPRALPNPHGGCLHEAGKREDQGARPVCSVARRGDAGPRLGQSQLDVGEAQAFLGQWVVDMQTDFGPFTMSLDVTDADGKVAASMGSPEMGGSQPIDDISKSEESLLLRFSTNAQGQMLDIEVALVPNGESLDVYFDVGGGQFSATGTATRAAS